MIPCLLLEWLAWEVVESANISSMFPELNSVWQDWSKSEINQKIGPWQNPGQKCQSGKWIWAKFSSKFNTCMSCWEKCINQNILDTLSPVIWCPGLDDDMHYISYVHDIRMYKACVSDISQTGSFTGQCDEIDGLVQDFSVIQIPWKLCFAIIPFLVISSVHEMASHPLVQFHLILAWASWKLLWAT